MKIGLKSSVLQIADQVYHKCETRSTKDWNCEDQKQYKKNFKTRHSDSTGKKNDKNMAKGAQEDHKLRSNARGITTNF